MAVYRIVYNGTDLWIPQTKDVLSPEVEIELNSAGHLTFTMAPGHPNFYTIEPLKGTMEVYEKNDLIWFGRPVTLERNMKNEKPVYCEGALAYFNDSAQRPRAKDNVAANTLFLDIISTHNGQVPANRQFTAGTVSISATIGWENEYTDSMSVMQSLLNKAGGYIIPRRSGSTNYLDYIYELPQSGAQPVQFALNMVDFKREYAFSDKFTAVLPVGGVADGATTATTIASVNGGSDILDGSGISEFGRIVKVIKYPDTTDASELLSQAQEYLAKVDFDPISITASAAELSFIDSNYQPFRVGNQYHVVSTPHDVNAWLPLVRMTIPMDKASRQITLGTESNKGITETYKNLEKQVDLVKETISPSIGGGDWDSPGSISGGDGDGWNHWVGTEEEYADLESHDSKTVYMTYLEE